MASNAPSDGAAGTSTGIGGKFCSRPFRRAAATPYDRPASALRGARELAERRGGGWLAKLVDPASRTITNGASRLFSSVLCRHPPLLCRTLPPPQTVSLVIGSIWVFLFSPEEEGPTKFALLSISIGFISLLIGELGRSHSLKILLRLYISTSSIATACSVACMIRSDSFFKVPLGTIGY